MNKLTKIITLVFIWLGIIFISGLLSLAIDDYIKPRYFITIHGPVMTPIVWAALYVSEKIIKLKQ